MMTDKEKLSALMDKFAGGSQQAFAQLIGVSRSNVATWLHRGSITANGREAILDAFPQVDRDWLVGGRRSAEEAEETWGEERGAGEVPETIYFSRHELVPLFGDCRASCGVAEQFEHPELATDFLHLPGVRAVAALPAEGISMEPTIGEGDICFVGEEVRLADVSPSAIYLVVTRQGQCMFKRICDEGPASPRILVLSENPAYTPQAEAVQKEDILHIYPLRKVLKDVG